MKFRVFSRRDWLGRKRWHWHLKSANGEIVASGEGYQNRSDCEAIVKKIKHHAPLSPIEEGE
jgi:uncharacterized protein YegP (UPF0339 family)